MALRLPRRSASSGAHFDDPDPLGASAEGDQFFWSVLGDDPERWPVTICSRNGPWWHYEGGMVQFLAELCAGVLEPWALPPVKPEITGWTVEGGGWRQTA
ncbi:hypothetical protein [Streptomyces sp. INR7]|uniref:hypothetical protein n=1 Tax=Streptomyces sp. INR7 TaxID=2607753 RepID=UPI002156217C|nr:hypothetical protein [Streptomyces sp. INR7]